MSGQLGPSTWEITLQFEREIVSFVAFLWIFSVGFVRFQLDKGDVVGAPVDLHQSAASACGILVMNNSP